MPNNDLSTYLDPTPRTRRHNYDDLIQKHASRTGLDPDLVRAVVSQESGGNPRAVSPKGAQGIGQLMPATAKRFNVRDPYDPDENLRGATDYLKFLNDRFKGNRDLVLAGYNAGEGAVDKFKGIPPYRETRNYVKSINARLGQRQQRQQQQPTQPQSDLDSYLDPVSPEQSPSRTSAGTRKSPPRATAAPANYDTQLTPDKERNFQKWKAVFAPDDSGVDYDLRGAYQAGLKPDAKGHWPDRFKKPNHPTFSNESQYAVGKDAAKAGRWRDEKFIPPTAPARFSLSGSAFGPASPEQQSQIRAGVREFEQPREQPRESPRITIRPNAGMGELHRLDDPEAQRITRIQQQVAAKDPMSARLLPARVARRAAQQASREREDELKAQANEPRLRELTQIYRKEIQRAKGLGIGPEQWLNEAAAKGAAGLTELVAGATRGLSPATALIGELTGTRTQVANNISLHAQAMQRAAEEEGADRNRVSRAIQNVVGGTIASAPEMGMIAMGAPPMAAFGTGGATRSVGRGERPLEVVKAGAHGVATGGAFQLPLSQIANPLTRVATRAGTTGLATGGLEASQGAPLDQAIEAGLTNALMAGVGEMSHIRREPSALERGLEREQARTLPLDVVRVRDIEGEFHVVGTDGDNVILANRGSSIPTMAVSRTRIEQIEPNAEIAARLRGEQRAPTTTIPEVAAAQREGEGRILREEAPRVRRESDIEQYLDPERSADERVNTPPVRSGRATMGEKLDEPQVQTKSPVEAQRTEVESASRTPTTATKSTMDAVSGSGNISRNISQESGPARFFHRDYGEVVESPNQRRVGKNRVRVVAEDGSEHVIKRAAMTGRGNQRAVPIRPEESVTVTTLVTESRPESTTAAKRESMSADRVALDLPELSPAERKSWQQSLSEAKPESAQRLADEVLNRPRALNDSETASIVVRAQQVKNEHAAKLREIESANESQLPRLKSELDVLEGEFDRLTQAARASGTEKGRALAAQKLTINQDFDLVSLVSRFKADAGRNPTPAERTQIEQLSKRNLELESKLAEANDKLAHSRLQSEINRISRRERRTQSRQSLDEEFAQLKQQFAQARAETKGVQPSGLAGLDPEGKLTRLIGKMARNRIQAGVTDAAQLVDDIHAAIASQLPNVSKREVRDAISGYSLAPKSTRTELQRQIDSLKSELQQLSKSEDINAGRRSPRQEGPQREYQRDLARQRAIQRQIDDLQQQMDSGQYRDKSRPEPPRYTRETYRLQKELDAVRAEYDRMKYRATATTREKAIDTALGVGNTPKTLMSMADFSALLRQGGYGSVTHPVLSTRAAQDMLRSITERGFANVEAEIKSRPLFEEAKQNGVEFTGIDKLDPRLSKREEGYLGSGFIDTLSKGKFNPLRYTVKPIKDISERTFVSFLDSQRMRIYEQQANAIKSMNLTPEQQQAALKAQAKLVNIATGRGSLGKRGNEFMPALNVAMFSPRLLASRIQLLNKMLNPVAWKNTPPGARKLMMIDNAKFLGFTLFSLGLAKAAGASVNLDPDDSEFLKIKVGNTRYDTLTGLQQPMRFFIRMTKAMRGGETYAGDPASDILLDFTRSKTSPEVGYLWDAIEGKNRLTGKQFSAGRDALKLATPLPFQDFQEAIKTDGVLRGMVEAMPSLVGVGSQTYIGAAEKPTSPAEKLARKFSRASLPDDARTQEEIDLDTQRSQLRARSRRGEDVSGELEKLRGKLTDRQIKAIVSARNKTRLQEDVNRLGIKDALLVYSVANEQQRGELKSLIERKVGLITSLPASEQAQVRQRLTQFGFSLPTMRITRPSRESRQSRVGR